MKKIIPFLLTALLLLSFHVKASHLMGGNLAYEYLGETFPGSGLYSYKVIFKTYTNCGGNSQFKAGPEGTAFIGIYHDDPNGGINKLLFQSLVMNIIDTTRITPDNPNGCSVGSDLCIDQGTYVDTIQLPLMINNQFIEGYYLYYERCCRNSTIVNLDNPESQGMGFYAFIPSPLTKNNSPVFTDLPLPFICSGDTVGILNTATDADGDLLLFSFEDPYEGEYTGDGTGGNPLPYIVSFPTTLNWPLPTVTWQSGGYNKDFPFGTTGSATIDGFTGYSKYFTPTIGNYVIAVEIKEYRNNVLIGITRRDMQLLVLNCPVNNAPDLSSSSSTSSFTITEGETLCFPVTYQDQDADSLILNANGSVIDPILTNPVGTITVPVTGKDSVSSQFCWTTGCGQGRGFPYLLNATATDNGCPNKITPAVYSINVNKYTGPTAINGPTSACKGSQNVSYYVTPNNGASYAWTIAGGSLISGATTDSITVDWGNVDYGKVSVISTSAHGCVSDELSIDVSLDSTLSVEAGLTDSICIGETTTIGGFPTTFSQASYVWKPAILLTNPTSANPIAKPLVTTTFYVTATASGNCVNTDSVTVVVKPSPKLTVSANDTICAGDTATLSVSGASIYSWSPTSSINNLLSPNPKAFPITNTQYTVIGVNTFGCFGKDSTMITVKPSPVTNAGNDIDTCKGALIALGTQSASGIVYAWKSSDSLSLSDKLISNPTLTTSGNYFYVLTATDTANGCSNSDTVFVNVFELETASTDTTLCADEPVQLTVSVLSGTPPITYSWTPTTGLSNPSVPNPVVSTGNSQNYIVISNDSKNCSDTLAVAVNLKQQPTADFEVVLAPSCNHVVATFTNLSTNYSTISWDINGTLLSEINPKVTLPFTSEITATLTVVSEDGCIETISKTMTAKSFESYFDLKAPNVFSPNGDGVNEWFELENMNLLAGCVSMSIFNRWGELMFESSDSNYSWDGRTFSGEKVSEGHYFYVIKVKDITLKGTVMVLR